jgi:hypothetical protein
MLDKLYYIIFNAYYKHGTSTARSATLTVLGLVVVAINSVLLLGYFAIRVAINPDYHTTKGSLQAAPGLVVSALLTYFFFYYRNRHLKIYEKNKNNSYYDKRIVRILAFAIWILLIISPFLFGLFWYRIHSGNWITFKRP